MKKKEKIVLNLTAAFSLTEGVGWVWLGVRINRHGPTFDPIQKISSSDYH